MIHEFLKDITWWDLFCAIVLLEASRGAFIAAAEDILTFIGDKLK